MSLFMDGADAGMLEAARQILQVPDLRETDDLFDAGLTSLTALTLADALNGLLRRDVTVVDIYHATTLERIRELEVGRVQASAAPLLDPGASVPASRAQRRFWLAEQYTPAAADNMLVLAYGISGPLDPELLRRALADVVVRHPILRTRYRHAGGDVVQDVLAPDEAGIAFDYQDAPAGPAALDVLAGRVTADWWNEPFDLDRQPPVRIRLWRIDECTHLLCLHVHHIAFDGRSEQIFIGDLSARYDHHLTGEPAMLPPAAATYVDYAVHERTAGIDENELGFWRRMLADPPQPPLPPPVNSLTEADRLELLRPVSSAAVDRIQQVVRHRRAPALAALIAATARALAEVFHLSDVCFGAISEGRSRAADAGTMGYFVNPVAVPLTAIRDRDDSELVGHAASQILDALGHASTPFDELVRSLRPSRIRHPWFQTLVTLQYEHPSGELTPGTAIRSVRVPPPRTATELSVQAFPVIGGGWNLYVAWRLDGCSPAVGRAIADGVAAALDRMADLAD